MKTSARGVALIHESESFFEWAYPDPGSPLAVECRKLGVKKAWGRMPAPNILSSLPLGLQKLDGRPWTAGYGFTAGITIDTHITREEADRRFPTLLVEYERGVASMCSIPPNQNQFDALVSLAWNIGVERLRTSSIIKAHNRGDTASAARAFGLYNKSRGVVYRGLTVRRAKEAALYLEPAPYFDQDNAAANPAVELPVVDMPQTVDKESSLLASPINRAATAAGGTAAILAPVADALNTANAVKYGIEGLGPWLVWIMAAVIIGLVGYIIYNRYNQRRQGWA